MGAARGEEDGEGRCGERCPSWYVSREEIESGSPSRRDGVSAAKEAELRATYCSFIRDVCIRLRLPQITMATAIMLCHRFYLRQSHAKNEWQTIATVCIFLGSKIEDTPCQLKHVVIVSYETMYHKNPDAAKRIHQEHEVLAKQKALILVGETLLLSTIRFDFNIHHPYEPLKLALKKLGIAETELRQSAMSLINDTLPSTLVIQFKPQYIAAASLWFAAKFHNVNLSQNGTIWWHVFDVAPDPLRVVVQQMSELFEKRAPCSVGPVTKPVPASSATDKHQIKPAPTHTPMDKHQIKQVPAPMNRHQIKPVPTPTPMDKHHIKQIPAPAPTCRHHIKPVPTPIPTPMDKQQNKLAPTPMDKQQNKLAPTPMDKQQNKPAAAPAPTDRCQRVSTPVPAPRDTQSSRRSFSSSSNTEAPRRVPAGRSSNEKPRDRSPRHEGHWCRGKDGENQHCQKHRDHNSEQRPEERSNQRALKSGLAYLVRSGGPKDTGAATEIRNLTRRKRRIQEVGGLPTPVYTSDTDAWRQVSAVVLFGTKGQKRPRGDEP
ncbi:cyclin-T1-1 [Zea mays]|uniref:Cyclin-T1-3 n=2 Tax=Zea mays TaxID=4577 RepID=A0A1D6GZP5_MAIZE|nr:cyclin-T1-1 [Zea mays]AQK68202.1 Cyclin-T1-3 [Zea mays]|eukprot:XP_008645216.1 cyclin-T1-1 [Zea mays]